MKGIPELLDEVSRRDLLRYLGLGAVVVGGCSTSAAQLGVSSGSTGGTSAATSGGSTGAGTSGASTTGGGATTGGATTGGATSGGATTGGTSSAGSSGGTGGEACTDATNVTRGPYFLDNAADPNISGDTVDALISERSDLRTDSEGSTGTQPGLLLSLTVIVNAASSDGGNCTPIQGAQVHLWHCNAGGVYSDVRAASNDNGADHRGQDFLRGYQVTDNNGAVMFTTIYPGWYPGRAVHIHAKIRLFDTSGDVTTEATTQFFFDDTVSTQVFAANPTYTQGTRSTLNTNDGFYLQENPPLVLSLSGSTTTSFSSTISVGIRLGTIFGG